MTELLIGRQPIFNRKLDVIAYELLYRSVGSGNKAAVFDGDQATTDVIINTFSEVGLDQLVGSKKAFINATHNFLVDKLVGKDTISLPPSRVVWEVLEDAVADTPLLDALQTLNSAGYWVALDDVISYEQAAPMMSLARIIKIDLMGIDYNVLPKMVVAFKERNLLLLAEKVETQQEFDYCLKLGFDFFQGYFLCKPSIVKGRRLDASRLVVLRSMAKLQDSRANFQELEEIIAQDVALGYKLLKLVNSGYYSLPNSVRSIRQAISLIGLNQLRAWMTLLLMTTVDNKPHELTTIALQRAKMCEMFAKAKDRKQSETYFLVGLLSILDALMDMPMEQVIASVPVSQDVSNALITHTGEYGEILETVMAYELGNWEKVLTLNLSSETIRMIYLDTLHWTAAITKEMYASVQGK